MLESHSAHAETIRQARRLWAAVGSKHDKRIRVMRMALPIGAVLLGGYLLAAPFMAVHDISFVLAKDQVDVSQERMRLSAASYRGFDSLGRPFQIDAESAVQPTSRSPLVKLGRFGGQIMLTKGLAVLHALGGSYNLDTEVLRVEGPIEMQTADGYHMRANDVNVHVKQQVMESRAGVNGVLPIGYFSADKMRMDMNSKTMTLDGRVHLHIDQHNGMGWKP
jgi:lipopolysaccharide export system protein LptC